MSKKNRLAVVGLAAGLLGGGAAGIALTSPGTASGQTAETQPDSTTGDEARGQSFLEDTLAPLVEDGTITQAQADAVIAAIEEARPERGFRHGPGGPFFGRGPLGDIFGAAAEEIGISKDDLWAAVRDGQTIAEIARANDVEPSAVVDAMVAAVKDDLDQAVENERLTQEEADEMLANAREHFGELVNGELPRFGHGPFGPREEESGESGDSSTENETSGASV
jgi:hypothetical protein